MEYEIVDIKRVFKAKNGKIYYEFNVLENGEEKIVALDNDSLKCQENLDKYYNALLEKMNDFDSKLIPYDNINTLFKFVFFILVFGIFGIVYVWLFGIIGWSFNVLRRVILLMMLGGIVGALWRIELLPKFDDPIARKELQKINAKLINFNKLKEKCKSLISENNKIILHDVVLDINRIIKENSNTEVKSQESKTEDKKDISSDLSNRIKNLQITGFGESLFKNNPSENFSFNPKKGTRIIKIDRPSFYNDEAKIANGDSLLYPKNPDVPEYLRRK